MSDRLLDKLAKILNQAENATTAEEAEAFLQKAQNLATVSSIDLAVARQHTAKREQREQPTHKRIPIGEAGKKSLKHYVGLFLAIGRNNDVRVNIGHGSVYVIVFGLPSDIEVVEVLYASLVFQMVESANAWLKTGEYKKEEVYRAVRKRDSWGDSYTDYVSKPIDGRTARANFYNGYITRVEYRLTQARYEALQAVKEQSYTVRDDQGQEVKSSAELVLKSKTEEVGDYYKATSTARGSWKGAKVSTTSSTAHNAGDSAGRSARLGSNKAIGGTRTAVAA